MESAPLKPTPTLLGHPIVQLRRTFTSNQTGFYERFRGFLIILISLKIIFRYSIIDMDSFGAIGKDLGKTNSFGLGRSYIKKVVQTRE